MRSIQRSDKEGAALISTKYREGAEHQRVFRSSKPSRRSPDQEAERSELMRRHRRDPREKAQIVQPRGRGGHRRKLFPSPLLSRVIIVPQVVEMVSPSVLNANHPVERTMLPMPRTDDQEASVTESQTRPHPRAHPRVTTVVGAVGQPPCGRVHRDGGDEMLPMLVGVEWIALGIKGP